MALRGFNVAQLAKALWNNTFVPLVDRTVTPSGGSIASVSGSVGSVTGAVGSVTGAVGSVTAGVTVSTNSDKTGYSLTAGSYSVRASSTQRGTITISTSTSGTATISSVTETRAIVAGGGNTCTSGTANDESHARVLLTNATTVTATVNSSTTLGATFDSVELF